MTPVRSLCRAIWENVVANAWRRDRGGSPALSDESTCLNQRSEPPINGLKSQIQSHLQQPSPWIRNMREHFDETGHKSTKLEQRHWRSMYSQTAHPKRTLRLIRKWKGRFWLWNARFQNRKSALRPKTCQEVDQESQNSCFPWNFNILRFSSSKMDQENEHWRLEIDDASPEPTNIYLWSAAVSRMMIDFISTEMSKKSK